MVVIDIAGGWLKRGPTRAPHLKDLLHSVILVLSSTKEMLSLDLFHRRSDWNVLDCFGTTLVRSWHMTDDPPAHSDLGAQFERLCLLLSDQNRVRAAGLHAAYNHCRFQITNDKSALETLDQQHYNLQCSLTPTHRLPPEIMMEIFHIALDFGQLRTGLMLVCRRWCKIIEVMASAWSSLVLGAGTTPERVQHLLSRAGTHPLAVKIDTNNAKSTAKELHSSLAMASSKASQWQTLAIISLSQDGPDAQSDHALTSMQLQPMKQLRHLYIKEPVLSPLLRLFLQNFATEAVEKLVSMEIHSLPAIQYLLQPDYTSIYCSITTFIAKVPKMSHSIDLLPHFIQLEVLDLTNLHLSITDNGSPLPLAHTLRHLRLKAASIQWMGGQVFLKLENCTIISPSTGLSLHHNVQLPACTELHFENWDISPTGQFFAPALNHLRAKSNAWSPYTSNGQVVQLVRVGLGMGLQPKSLSLNIVCKEKVLLAALQLLPGLVELKMDLPRSSALGTRFFTGLLAKPGNQGTSELQFDWRELFRESRTGWRCNVCPSLRILELKYQRWLRPADNDDFLPPLLALSWSRGNTATPLQLHVHFKSSMNSVESWNPTPQDIEVISYIKLLQRGQVTHLALQTMTWDSAVLERPLFAPFLNRLQIVTLNITNHQPGHERPMQRVLNVLPSFHDLRELNLSYVDVTPIARDVNLPLVHTLQKLSLSFSSLAWMDGLVFTQLQRFSVDEYGWPQTFKRKVAMLACTHIVYDQHGLKALHVLQSNFDLPLLDTFEFSGLWNRFLHDDWGMSAGQRIQAKNFKFRLFRDSVSCPYFLEPKDEVEELDLIIEAEFALSAELILTRMSTFNRATRKLPCPNMKVLRLQFLDVQGADREQVSRSCRQMMIKRQSVGYSMEKCYIWWSHGDWNKPAPLVLVMKNVVVCQNSMFSYNWTHY